MVSPVTQARRRLASGFDEMAELTPEERVALERFLVIIERYGVLEILSLGEIRYDLPAHFGVPKASPRIQGEHLAAQERDLLEQAREGELDLVSVLEERGIKIFEAPVASDLGSVFTYEAAIGPAIFVNTAAGASETRFWLAHAYAHLVADFDPYRVRICRPAGSRLMPPPAVDLEEWLEPAADLSSEAIAASEERASVFAEAMLLPADLLADFLRGARRETGHALSPDVFLQMEDYFGVGAFRIASRLANLGAMNFEDAAALAREAGTKRGAAPAAAEPALPRRMIDLAVGAFHQSKISMDELAESVETDRRGVKKLLSVYRLRDAALPEREAEREAKPEREARQEREAKPKREAEPEE